MIYRIILLLLLLLPLSSCAQSQGFNTKESWQAFVQTVEDNYAYLDTAPTDWEALKAYYQPLAINATTQEEFVDVLQVVKQFFIDPHFNVSPLNEADYSVTPTGSDIWVEKQGDDFVITRIKAGSAAAKSQLALGDMIVGIDGESTEAAIQRVFGNTSLPLTDAHKTWAVNVALGGRRNQERHIEVASDFDDAKRVQLAASYDAINLLRTKAPLIVKQKEGIGYIRFNNNLGNSETVRAFKEALESLESTQGLVIDLRNTPSGGNTGVAEPILGHFVNANTAYQGYKIQNAGKPYQEAELHMAHVTPSLPYYSKPVVVLVGHWTGSMGEGMAIGFDAIGAKAVIGTPMADLLGGINQFQLPDSTITLELGFERLYHVNGSYREDFVPQAVSWDGHTASDSELNAAIALLKAI